jgi:ADP-heptose:LPS heptosyltransferase
MKILVLSLLRVGDTILMAPVLRGLRDRYPEAKIHLMMNSQFLQIAPLMPYVDRFIGFDRELLQDALATPETPLFESYERLNEFFEGVGAESYDLAVNLTHNRLSGWVMSLIDAKKRLGLCFDTSGRAAFGSSWFRYLNNQVDLEASEVFHFTDVFRFALELGSDADSWVNTNCLSESEAGRAEAAQALLSFSDLPILAVQPLTSDSKKEWGLVRFHEALGLFKRTNPQVAVAILGSPSEKARLEPFVAGLQASGLNAQLVVLSLEGAFSFLKNVKLLLTGDTSIKHLACAAKTPVVELSLGSSDYHRTGAYLHGSVIMQSREACAPCVHSAPCHQKSHLCGARIPVEAVAMTVSEVFARRSFQLKHIAEEYESDIEILRVETKTSGFWAACSVLENFSEKNVGHWIDLLSRKIWLHGPGASGADRGAEMGTEIRRLGHLLKTLHPTTSGIEWRHLLDGFETQATMVEGRLNGFRTGLRVLNGCYEDPKRLRDFVKGLMSFRERIRHSPSLCSFKSALDSVIEDDISPAFTRFRRINDAVAEIGHRTSINLRLIRGLSTELDREVEIEKI